jgi:hypothetical protein
VAKLPRLGGFMAQKIGALAMSKEYEEKKLIIGEITDAVITEMQMEGLSNSESKFLVDHGPGIHERIANPGLRQMNVWVG